MLVVVVATKTVIMTPWCGEKTNRKFVMFWVFFLSYVICLRYVHTYNLVPLKDRSIVRIDKFFSYAYLCFIYNVVSANKRVFNIFVQGHAELS